MSSEKIPSVEAGTSETAFARGSAKESREKKGEEDK
jgi:hypothetical protein